MTRDEIAQEALRRARSQSSIRNEMAVILAFRERGVDDVRPRENVLTFNGWRALGRTVRKGETGVALTTYIAVKEKAGDDAAADAGERRARKAKTVHVFHVSQTVALADQPSLFAAAAE